MFYPGSEHLLIPGPDPNMFSSRIIHEKSGMQAYFFLASFGFRWQRSGKNSSQIRIPDPGGKKALDPRFRIRTIGSEEGLVTHN
jgi:hypothetical protein